MAYFPLESPLVSIIVPNYNHATYLPERLASISNQTYINIEIILLDDASTDNSAQVLQDFQKQEPRVTQLDVNTVNSGKPNTQWIKGIALARGEYIWIAESDDMAAPELLQSLVSVIHPSQNLGLVYSHSTLIDESSNVIGYYDYAYPFYSEQKWQQDWTMTGQEMLNNYLVFRNVIPNASGVLFRKSVLEKVVDNSNHYKCFGDWYVYLNIALTHDFAFVARPLNLYRHHDKTTRWHTIVSHRRAMREKLNILKQFKRYIKQTDNLSKSVYHLFKNRNKYARINRFISRIRREVHGGERVVIYALNDIAKYLLAANGQQTVVNIIDNNKVGVTFKGIEVISVDNFNPDSSDVVVICSPRYANDMTRQVLNRGFHGKVLAYEE